MLGLSPDWQTMREFIVSADLSDAGQSAAEQILGYSLATAAEAITGVRGATPTPSLWVDSPFGGGYSRTAMSTGSGKQFAAELHGSPSQYSRLVSFRPRMLTLGAYAEIFFESGYSQISGSS